MSMHKIDYGDANVACGLFLRRLGRLDAATTKRYHEVHHRSFAHLSTFVDRSTINEAILQTLQEARTYIFFVSFLIQDDDITEALIAAAKRLHGHVYVLTTLKNQDFEAAQAEKDEAADEGWSFQDHIQHIAQLTASGIFVKARKDCHAKFVIADDTCAIVTSANAAPTCYVNIDRPNGTQRPANGENGVLITIPSEVARLGNFFRVIWRSGSNYYVSPDADLFDIGQYTDEIVTIKCAEPRERDARGEALWTAPGDTRIRDALLAMIGEAKHRIRMSSMFMEGMESHAFGEALSAAARDGVETEIILRRTHKPERLRSCYCLKKTMGDRLTILGDYYNHSKALLIDNTNAMVMTANLDANHGLDCGVEVAFRSCDKRFAKAVSHFLDKLQAQAHLEFVADPTQAQAAERWPGPKATGLADRLHLHITPMKYPTNEERAISAFISALETELVRVRYDIAEGDGSRLLLVTDALIAHCQRHDPSRLTVLHIEEYPRKRVLAGPGSVLSPTTITVTTS